MKLIEALRVLHREEPSHSTKSLSVAFVCGFEPLHLETLLRARLTVAYPEREVHVRTGLYGDLFGNLTRVVDASADHVVIALEWPDLDPRLGLRSTGGWDPAMVEDVLHTVRSRSNRLHTLLEAVPDIPVVVCLPTLPLPPVSVHVTTRAGILELELNAVVESLALGLGRRSNIRVLSRQWLNRTSPPGDRLDARSELRFGFPYKLPHADALSEGFCRLMTPRTPKKGLISDLDDTMWKGLLGEDGPEGISWDLARHSHGHALYQQLLRSLSASGALIGVASKNDPALVDEAFRTRHPALPKECIFPLEVHWGPKSESVERILEKWNLAPDDVVFVDDTPLELAEVSARFPAMECIQFPNTEQEIVDMLVRLRDLFGRDAVSEEDRIRLSSLQRAHDLTRVARSTEGRRGDILQDAGANLTTRYEKSWDSRAFELINKTNQFNLNGVRWTEREFREHVSSPGAFLMVSSYADKYGPLGKVCVIAGRQVGPALQVDSLVMSCRAFSRQIEHACLRQLFQRFEAGEIRFDYRPTARNGPLREFLSFYLDAGPEPGLALSRRRFDERCPPLRLGSEEVIDD